MTDTNQLREAFEVRMTDGGKWPAAVEKGRGGAYRLAQTENAWTEWQACAESLQALAQVQGEPFGYIHHYVAHDDSGVIIDTTWEADGCADALPHPTHPAAWKWSHATPFYTTPQPAQATQPAEVTLPHLWPVIRWLKNGCDVADAITELELYERHIEKARTILALRPVQVPMTREQAMAIVQSNPDTMTAIRMTEAHHGITAQAKKETP